MMFTVRNLLILAILWEFQPKTGSNTSITTCLAWSNNNININNNKIKNNNNANINPSQMMTTRRGSLATAFGSIAIATATAWNLSPPTMAQAAATDSNNSNKLIGISNDELAKIIQYDIETNQFMVSADITRSVYAESATFTDEIDTYQMDQWIKGTKKLFIANQSHVDLVPNSLQVSNDQATFQFTETLMFNIPIIKPKVYLSGKVIFSRDPSTGLITSYREQWDQDVKTVLTKANYFSS